MPEAGTGGVGGSVGGFRGQPEPWTLHQLSVSDAHGPHKDAILQGKTRHIEYYRSASWHSANDQAASRTASGILPRLLGRYEPMKGGAVTPKRSTKRLVADRANAILALVGVRLESLGMARVLSDDKARLLQALILVYQSVVFPQLRPRGGRERLLHDLAGTEVPEAFFLLNHLQAALDSGPGDVCEFGVAQGCTSALLANEILEYPTRSLWLYDSFEGLSEPQPEDILIDDIFNLETMDRYAGSMANPEDLVRDRLAAMRFPGARTHLVRRFISEDIDPGLLPQRVAFAYVDFDLYAPILAALRLVHPRTRPGSIMMVDDYGFFSAGPASAVKLFMEEHEGAYTLEVGPLFAGHFCLLTRLGD